MAYFATCLALHASGLNRIGASWLPDMLAIIQAISLFGLKVEADGRCESEVLSA